MNVSIKPSMERIEGPLAWSGQDFGPDASWAFRLDADDLEELKGACQSLASRSPAFADIEKTLFPLPRLAPRLAQMGRDLRSQRGFALIKGIDVDQYTEAQLRLVVLGIASHLGVSVSQSFRGDYLGDVMNYAESGNERPYRRGGVFEMHRDPCDIVGLLCYRKARSGGLSRVASCAAIWNTLVHERPELIAPLLEGFRLYLTRDDRSGDSPVTALKIPVFTNDPDGLMHATFIRELATSGVEKGGEQWAPGAQEALAVFYEISQRPGVFLDMSIERGDIQFLNNRTTVHGRTDYEDWPEPERRRLMFRVWIMRPDWPQPATSINRLLFGLTDRADGGVGRRAALA
ncbi:MAG: TauD/TfdA family dioxygenase [Burkholderiaceae bacterium]